MTLGYLTESKKELYKMKDKDTVRTCTGFFSHIPSIIMGQLNLLYYFSLGLLT